jgi:hypothetical protein
MPKKTYVQLNSITLAAASASVEFNNIPQNYRDLVLIINASTDAARFPRVVLNGDSGTTNYLRITMDGNGTTAQSATGTVSFITISGNTNSDTSFAYQSITNFLDYSATDKHKTSLTRVGSVNSSVSAIASRWINTAAISRLQAILDAGTYSAGSTFAIYGIEA